MSTIQACQHIYSNVEKEQSPQRRGGFQTLFYSHAGLDEAEISELEGRLLYFPGQTEPVKRLFFRLASGKGVVAQIVPLPEPDQLGRKGRYLAHSLIFTPEALAAFEADPFRVFRRFRFITSVAEALAQGDAHNGDIPPMRLELPAQPQREIEAVRSWSAPELKKLALLTLQAEAQAQQREALTLAGSPTQIEQALEAAWMVAPAAFRSRCAFDTYFYRCNLVACYFWAIGLPQPPVSIKFALVDAANRQVQGATPQPQSAYEQWLLATLEAGQAAQLPQQRDNAWLLGAWIEGQPTEEAQLDQVLPELVAAMFQAAPEAVKNLLQRRIADLLPAPLAPRTAEYFYQHTAEWPLYQQLRQGLAVPQLLDRLYQSYQADELKSPGRGEVKAVTELLAQHPHELLTLAAAYWRSPDKELPLALDTVSEAAYRHFGADLLQRGLVKPLTLLRPRRSESFLELYLAGRVEDWADLCEALLEQGQTLSLARLADQLPKFSDKELHKVAKLIEDQPNVPGEFSTAVAQALAARPAESGIKGFIQAVWRRLPGQD
jgi:hypothetical protein